MLYNQIINGQGASIRMKWSTIYQNLPIRGKWYLFKKIGWVSDFVLEETFSEGSLYFSPSTEIEVSFCVDTSGLSVAVWFPDAPDPTYTDHQIFIANPHFKMLQEQKGGVC